jgi:hypothetical protein
VAEMVAADFLYYQGVFTQITRIFALPNEPQIYQNNASNVVAKCALKAQNITFQRRVSEE